MKRFKKKIIVCLFIVIIALTSNSCRQNDEFIGIVEEAYTYALPLVMMDLTRQSLTNVYELDGVSHGAPINQFYHIDYILTAEDRIAVRPNVDTIYSIAWLDLSDEPIVFRKPATDFYATAAIYDAYTNCYHVLGTGGLGGNEEAVYTIHGPNFYTEVLIGSYRVTIPTNMAFVVVRMECNDNLVEIQALQREMTLIPLSEHQNPDYSLPAGTFDEKYLFEPFSKVQEMDIEMFFNTFNQLALENPATEDDLPALERFTEIGVGAGLVFSLDDFQREDKKAFQRIPARLIPSLINFDSGRKVNGWEFFKSNIARFGIDYEFRAHVALVAIGANPEEMAMYLSTAVDSEQQPLHGNQNYVIRFETGQLPPNGAFWSITAYDTDWYLIPNENNKYSVSSRDNFFINPDGSIEIYLQYDMPDSELLVNWLPIPRDIFKLTLRIYRPEESVLTGQWEPPAVIKRSN